MKADNPNFTVAVSLEQAKGFIEGAIRMLDEGMPTNAIGYLREAGVKLIEALAWLVSRR